MKLKLTIESKDEEILDDVMATIVSNLEYYFYDKAKIVDVSLGNKKVAHGSVKT